MGSKGIFACVINFLLLLSQPNPTIGVEQDDTLADNDSPDPFKNICQYYSGEYFKEYEMGLVCCGNSSLKLPAELFSDNFSREVFQNCSRKFKDDTKSDLPSAMWKGFLCELQKLSVFKSNKITFDELANLITKSYPDTVKAKLKQQTAKCAAIDNESLEDHQKVQKFMECYNEGEYQVCHKPFGSSEPEDSEDDIKDLKELGCPVIHGFEPPTEYCCKGRSLPYRISEFPFPPIDQTNNNAADMCQNSFGKREKELRPDTFSVAVTSSNTDDIDHQMHTTWDVLCMSACFMEKRNYNQSMLKLDFEAVAKFFTRDLGKSVKTEVMKILHRRKNKDKIFLAMEVDSEKTRAMNYQELSKHSHFQYAEATKFLKANEKEKIQYYCKFIDTISFEERRAMHEYCFGEKYGNEWGNNHHSWPVTFMSD